MGRSVSPGREISRVDASQSGVAPKGMVRMNHIAGPVEFERAFGVSRETLVRLEVYAGLLRRWQPTINLVAPNTIADVWHQHFGDSAQLLKLAPAGPLRWLDLGSGGGFPGLVIGCLLAERSGSRLTMIESDARKCAFLREAVRQMAFGSSVTVDIVTDRIENVANTSRVGQVEIISARALAPLGRLLGWCEPFFGAETKALLPKGRDVNAEIVDARNTWKFEFDCIESATSAEGRIVAVRKLIRLGK